MHSKMFTVTPQVNLSAVSYIRREASLTIIRNFGKWEQWLPGQSCNKRQQSTGQNPKVKVFEVNHSLVLGLLINNSHSKMQT